MKDEPLNTTIWYRVMCVCACVVCDGRAFPIDLSMHCYHQSTEINPFEIGYRYIILKWCRCRETKPQKCQMVWMMWIREPIWNASIQVIFGIFSLPLSIFFLSSLCVVYPPPLMPFSPDLFGHSICIWEPLLPFFRFTDNQNIYLLIIHRSIWREKSEQM